MSALNQNIVIQINAPGANVAIAQIQQALSNTANSAKNVGAQFAAANKAIDLASNAMLAFANAANRAIDNAALFQVQIAQIRTIAQDQGVSFNQWSDAVLRLSREFGKPAADVAAAAYEVVSDQVAKGAQNFDVLTEAVKLAKVGVTSTTAAVGALDGALTSFELDSTQANRVAATLFKTIELGRGKISDLSNTIGRVGGVANSLGVSLEEVGAAISTITVKGTKTSDSITLLTNILLKLVKPTEAMKGLFRDLGVESGQAAIATFGLGGFLTKLAEAANKNPAIFAELGGELRAIKGFLALAGDGAKAFNENLVKISGAQESYNNALKEFDVPGAAYLKALNAVSTAFIKLGNDIQNVLGKNNFLLNFLAGFTEHVGDVIKVASTGFGAFGKIDTAANTRAIENLISESKALAEATKSKNETSVAEFGTGIDKIKQKVLSGYTEQTKAANASVKSVTENLKVASEATRLGLQFSLDPISNKISELRRIISDAKSIADSVRSFGARTGGEIQKSDVQDRIKGEDDLRLKLRLIETEKRNLRRETQELEAKGDKDSLNRAQELFKEQVKLNNEERDIKIRLRKEAAAADAAARGISGPVRVDVTDLFNEALRKNNTLLKDNLSVQEKIAETAQKDADAAKQEVIQQEIRKRALEDLAKKQAEFSFITAEGKIKPEFGTDAEKAGKEALRQFDINTENIIKALKLSGANEATIAAFRAESGNAEKRKALELQIQEVIKQKRLENEVTIQAQKMDNIKKEFAEQTKLNIESLKNRKESIQKIRDALETSRDITSGIDLSTLVGKESKAKNFGEITNAFGDLVQKIKDAQVAAKTAAIEPSSINVGKLKDALDALNKSQENAKTSGVNLDATFKGTNITLKEFLDSIQRNSKSVVESQNALEASRARLVELSERLKQASKELGIDAAITTAATASTTLAANMADINSNLEPAANNAERLSAALSSIPSGSFNISVGGGPGGFEGGLIKGYAGGGQVRDPRDNIPIMAADGEFMVNSEQTKKFLPLLEAINTGRLGPIKGFAGGGSVTNVGDIHITAQGNTADETMRDVGRKLRRELKRGTISFNT